MCVHILYNRNKLEYKPLKDKSEMRCQWSLFEENRSKRSRG